MRLNCVKLGTESFGPALVRSKKNMPKEGEIVFIKQDIKETFEEDNSWIKVLINKINDNCVFVKRL